MDMTDIKTNSFKAWVLAARPKTLAGAATPVIIGLALAYSDGSMFFQWTAAILCLLFAFLMQIDANFINDFYDYAKGTDREDRLGPERACAQGWVSLGAMKHVIAITTLIACAVGLPLVYYGGLEMLLVGAVCVLFAFLYTMGLSYKGWGDILVFLFFGIIPVGITYYVQLHTWTWNVTIASAACGLAIDTLLNVNNYRDRVQDSLSGKKTLVVRFGEKTGRFLYLGAGVAAALLCLFYLPSHTFAALLPLIYLLLHFMSWNKMVRINQGKELNKILGETARNIFIFGLLLAAGLLI